MAETLSPPQKSSEQTFDRDVNDDLIMVNTSPSRVQETPAAATTPTPTQETIPKNASPTPNNPFLKMAAGAGAALLAGGGIATIAAIDANMLEKTATVIGTETFTPDPLNGSLYGNATEATQGILTENGLDKNTISYSTVMGQTDEAVEQTGMPYPGQTYTAEVTKSNGLFGDSVSLDIQPGIVSADPEVKTSEESK